ncbi:MAG: cupredoxin domain-containing protein [Mycobacteriales bacterium]
MSTRTLTAALGATAALVAGCAGHSSGPGAPSTTPTTAAPAPGAAVAVAIRNFAYSPAKLTVHVGQTVTWTNQDATAHTVMANGGAFHSADLGQGQSYSFTFTRAGNYPYYCTIHPFMTASVTVD